MTTSRRTDTGEPALELVDLDVAYRVRGRSRTVLRGVSLAIEPGDSYGLVGESGCGKTTAALAAVRYLPRNGLVHGGTVRVAGTDVYSLARREVQEFHRTMIAMVYQNSATALNPSMRIGLQVAEAFEVQGIPRAQALERAHAALSQVLIADPGAVMGRHAHQLSGGMQQRVVIAMALAKTPSLLLLDEPTTGLDVTVEAEILDLVTRLQKETNTAAIFITHNLGVVAKMCQRIGVLYAGRLVEEGPTQEVLVNPRHPYTIGLIRCIPTKGIHKSRDRLETIPGLLPPIGREFAGCVFVDRCSVAEDLCRRHEPPLVQLGADHLSRCHFPERMGENPRLTLPRMDATRATNRPAGALLTIDGLSKVFEQHGRVRALTDVSAAIRPGETLGLVGESGSGKSTLAHALVGILEPTTGAVALDGKVLASHLRNRGPDEVQALQLVFQNPESALNRSHRVSWILRHSVKRLAGLTGADNRRRVLELVKAVRLSERHLAVQPRHLSGGLKQRVAVAAAFAGNPRLVVCDEPTSALDVSVQAAILNLLADLQDERGVSYLFISHDLGVVRYISDRIAVMYLGRLMEVGSAERVFSGPHHPYTESLLSAVPTIERGSRPRIKLDGEIPSAAHPPAGCVFHTRCHRKIGSICETVEPPLVELEQDHMMRCHLTAELLGRE